VSHDLRGPLRSIDGFSLAILEDFGDKLDGPAREYLQRVRAAAVRMGELIDDLLALSRVTRTQMSEQAVDLSAMATGIMAELQSAAPQRRLDLSIAPNLTARGDARLLRVAMENLLGNAWKFTSARPTTRIEFGRLTRDGTGEDSPAHNGGAAYFVRDNGAGFDMAHASNLFVPFQRLHAPSEFPGTGVGLATVQRIIRRHGGLVWAEAEVEKGATFFFTL